MRFYQVLSAEEAKGIAEQIKGMEWTQGKASSAHATGTVKQNRELQVGSEAEWLLKDLHQRIEAHPLTEENLIRLMLVPKFNRYGPGEAYHSHADAAWMGRKIRTDLACTLFLTDNYEGGELCVNGMAIKGTPGTCVVYECWRPHEVKPVTKGERICAVTWMQSQIRDATEREVIGLFRGVLSDIDRTSREERHYARLSAIYGKLMRMWME